MLSCLLWGPYMWASFFLRGYFSRQVSFAKDHVVKYCVAKSVNNPSKYRVNKSTPFKRWRYFSLCFSGLVLLSPCYGKEPPSLPSELPPPQSFLSLDDLIPDPRPSTSSPPSAATLFDDRTPADLSQTQTMEQRKEAEIARLLRELKYCANANEAQKLSKQVQRLWLQSGSETIDLLMQWAENGISSDNYGLALDYLDTIIALNPTYAEAWVRRAWVHIQMSDFKLAMFDLSHALKLEPRNYLAYFELGLTMEATDRIELAIKAYEMALHYYPQMRKLQKRIGLLLDEKSPQGT